MKRQMILYALGWIWDEENKYFKHPKSNQIFILHIFTWIIKNG